MKYKIELKINYLADEMQSLVDEKRQIHNRINEIDTRMHQIVGAIHELQSLITDQDCQSCHSGGDCSRQSETENPSAYSDLNNHQEQLEEIEKHSQRPS